MNERKQPYSDPLEGERPSPPWTQGWRIFFIVVLAIAIAIWVFWKTGRSETAIFPQAEEVRFTLGTVVRIQAEGDRAQQAVEAAFEEMERLTALLDRFNPTGDIGRINVDGSRWTTVSTDTIQLLKQSLHIAEKTKGAFDPTIAPLIDVWGFVETRQPASLSLDPTGMVEMRGRMPPTKAVIEHAMELVDYESIEVDTSMSRVRLVTAGQQLDLGGVAKGFAADRAARIMSDYGVDRAIIDVGGDVMTVGHRNEIGDPWRLGLRHPRKDGILAVVLISDAAVATSGDYERYFEYNGRRYNHIIDPRTGASAEDLMSATVVAPSATEADALATAVFVLGVDDGMALLEQWPGAGGILVDAEGRLHVSENIRHRVEMK